MSTAALSRLPGFFTPTVFGNEATGRKRSLQAEKRRAALWTDQHGRAWAAEMDVKVMRPCTPLRPFGWKAPILPPPAFIQFVDTLGQPQITIDYAAWRQHQGALASEWNADLLDIAQRMFPNSWAREVQDQNPLLLAKMGPMPYSVEFVRAAEQENRWVLGLSTKRPAWVTDALLATIPTPKRVAPDGGTLAAFPDADDDDDTDDVPTVTAKRGPGRPRKEIGA